ncbi:bZIP transcription factor 11-like [Musa acuminata AAA Group]|uniref:bZIP transcription factor 11-like n=1 Tax=Musa acuminata AAA Group TaxID=214697 RepID=UPI0031CE109F
MASPGGTSSASSLLHGSGSDEGLQAVMDEKKRKRLISNRESARRSRLRKQKHLDDLVAQANQLRKENSHGFAILKLVTQHCAAVEAENSVLRAQMMELSSRLQSLDDRLHNLNGNNGSNHLLCDGPQFTDNIVSPWNFNYMNQPIMASSEDMLYF